MRIHHLVHITGKTTGGDTSLIGQQLPLCKVVKFSKKSSRISHIVCKHPDTKAEIHFNTDSFEFIEALK